MPASAFKDALSIIFRAFYRVEMKGVEHLDQAGPNPIIALNHTSFLDAAVALSMLPEIDPRAALPPMTPYYLMRCGATALVPYYRPGDPAVADAIKGLAGKYASVLLANHGPVVSGDTLEAAVFAMEELEETAKLYLLLRGLNPRYLSPEQVADLTRVFGLTLPEHKRS